MANCYAFKQMENSNVSLMIEILKVDMEVGGSEVIMINNKGMNSQKRYL